MHSIDQNVRKCNVTKNVYSKNAKKRSIFIVYENVNNIYNKKCFSSTGVIRLLIQLYHRRNKLHLKYITMEKALVFQQKDLLLCSKEKRRSYGFETT